MAASGGGTILTAPNFLNNREFLVADFHGTDRGGAVLGFAVSGVHCI
jgi:hypothetical protein